MADHTGRPARCAAPGPAILTYAQRGLYERNIVALAAPSLEALAAASGETINLAVPPAPASSTSRSSTPPLPRAGQWVGRRVDYHCTAVGKVFLATAWRACRPGRWRRLRRHDHHPRSARDRARAVRREATPPPWTSSRRARGDRRPVHGRVSASSRHSRSPVRRCGSRRARSPAWYPCSSLRRSG